MVCTFQKVDGTGMVLSDFAFDEVQSQGANKIIFSNPNGAQLKVPQTADPTKMDAVEFYYVHPGWCTDTRSEWIPGWYWAKKDGVSANAAQFKLGSSSSLWAGDYPVPYGTQIGVYRTSNNSATLTFNGAVAPADQEIVATEAKGRFWTGNVMPVDYTLKDFSFTEIQSQGANKIIFSNPNGAQLKVPQTADPTKMDAVEFYYVHPGWCTDTRSEWIPGWYWVKKDGVSANAAQFKLGSSSSLWAGDYPIPAGQGFGIYRTSNNPATLKVPSPIAK